MFTTLRGRVLAGLALLAMVGAACASNSPGVAQTGVAESDASEASDDQASDSGSATTAGTTADESANPSPTAAPVLAADDSGLDAKVAAARDIADLGSAEEPLDLDGADVAQLVLDVPNDGEIEQPLGADRWTFTAEEGSFIAVDMLAIDNDCRQDLTLVLESPTGERGEIGWVGNGGCHVHGPLLITETGTHVFEFQGGDGGTIEDDTGSYRFLVSFLTERDVLTLVFDEPNDGEITETFGVDRWPFAATEGDLISIEVLAIDHDCRQDLTLTIEDPFGERDEITWVGNGGCEAHGPFELERTGTYVIEFHGGDGGTIEDNTGSYRFVPSFLTERDEQVAAADTRLDGEITQLFGADRWTFEGSEGALLTVDVLAIDHDCRQDLTLTVEDPFGERDEIAWVGNGGCQAHGPIELERTGTYVIEFSGGAGGTIEDNTGGYSFTYSLG